MDSEVYQRIRDIKHDSTHGASWLAREAGGVLKRAAESACEMRDQDLLDYLGNIVGELVCARPGMAPIANYVARFMWEVREEAKGGEKESRLREFAIGLAAKYIQDSKKAVKKAAEHAAEMLAGTDRVMTCSYSSTITETFGLAKGAGKDIEVIVAESRVGDKKYGELAAQELVSRGVSTLLISDDAVLDHITRAGVVIVGADSVLRDGSVINGVPSYRVAEAAGQSGIPFYAICELAKFNPVDIKVEEGFDLVPPPLVTGIITENGIATPGKVTEYIGEMEKYITALPSQLSLHQGDDL